jgi:hypothetical protein
MRYYVKYSESGQVLGFMEYPYANETMTEVTKEEYYALRGEEVPPEPLTDVQLTQQDITDLQLSDIERGQEITEIQLQLLGAAE